MVKMVTIVGVSGSGKTTAAEAVIRGLRERGRSVASAKTIACGRPGVTRREGLPPHREGEFSIDAPGSNSDRHRRAGSQLVITRAAKETAVLFQEELPLERVLAFFRDFDYVVLEGDYDAPVPRIVTGWEEADTAERMDRRTFAVSGRVAAGRESFRDIPAFDVTTPEGAAALAALAEEKAGEVSL